jgi:hypothetical protein
MGGRCVDETDDEGNPQDVRLEALDYKKIGKIAANSLCRTSGIEFMYVYLLVSYKYCYLCWFLGCGDAGA